MSVDFLTNAISTVGKLLVNFYVFERAINHRCSYIQRVAAVLWCLIFTLIFAVGLMPPLMFRIIYSTASIVFIWKLLKIKIDTILTAFLLSYGISYVFYLIAWFVIGFIFVPFLTNESAKGDTKRKKTFIWHG